MHRNVSVRETWVLYSWTSETTNFWSFRSLKIFKICAEKEIILFLPPAWAQALSACLHSWVPDRNSNGFKCQHFFYLWIFYLIVLDCSGGSGGRTAVSAQHCRIQCLVSKEVREGAARAWPSDLTVYWSPAQLLNNKPWEVMSIMTKYCDQWSHWPIQAQIIIWHLPGSRLIGVLSPYIVLSWPECSCMFQELPNSLLSSRELIACL